MLEAGALVMAAPLLGQVGRGDASPVLVIPGFSATDASTAVLRYYLRTWGYWAHGWRLGSNLGPTLATLRQIGERLDSVYDRHGRKVVLTGQSAGGLYARHLARKSPDKVRQVLTLGSPIQMVTGDRSSISMITERLAHTFDPDFLRLADRERGCLPVPSTSIYSRGDGVVRWHACLDVADDCHENVEVYATHIGIAVNPATLHVIADRLRQRDGEWKPFKPPRLARGLFPPPSAWEERARQSVQDAVALAASEASEVSEAAPARNGRKSG